MAIWTSRPGTIRSSSEARSMDHQEKHNPNQGERPYRSHLRPACLPCRRRKSRCQTEANTSTCLMCRAHGTSCVFPGDSAEEHSQSALPTPKVTPNSRHRRRSNFRNRTPVPTSFQNPLPQPRVPGECRFSGSLLGTETTAMDRTRLPNLANPHNSHGGAVAEHSTIYDEDPFDSSADDHAQNLHIVGPAVTKDSQVLSDYLSAIPGATRGTRMIVPVPAHPSRPVLFTRVQKRPLGVSVNRNPSAEKLEIIEKVLGSHAQDVIDV